MCIAPSADERATPSDPALAEPETLGCAFVLDQVEASVSAALCNAPRQPGSSYCPPHHALCHLASGSAAEHRQLREIAALAKAIGGKQGRIAPSPPAALLRRLRRLERLYSRPNRS